MVIAYADAMVRRCEVGSYIRCGALVRFFVASFSPRSRDRMQGSRIAGRLWLVARSHPAVEAARAVIASFTCEGMVEQDKGLPSSDSRAHIHTHEYTASYCCTTCHTSYVTERSCSEVCYASALTNRPQLPTRNDQ